MSQPTVASYFNTRKRVAVDELSATRNKVLVLENNDNVTKSGGGLDNVDNAHIIYKDTKNFLSKSDNVKPTARTTRSIKRIGPSNVDEKGQEKCEPTQPKLVKFMKMGNLSPLKRMTPTKEPVEFAPKSNSTNVERGLKTPTKQTMSATSATKDKLSAVSNLSLDQIKMRLNKSSRLAELKTSLNKLQSGFDKLERLEKARTTAVKPESTAAKNLKEFTTIELEVISPKKCFTSPIKRLLTPPSKQSLLMSPHKAVTPRKLLFSPVKEGSAILSPTKLPAYQRFQGLAESSRPSLQMPFKYRCLSELFKCMDTVCSMFYNRKEKITFKKMKPAVQRMVRKNVYESHLAQIKALYPDAFIFTQEKTRNFGSATKQDTFQLVIVPNVENPNDVIRPTDENNIIRSGQNLSMNPQVLIDRCQKFNKILLEKVKDEHEKFLLGLTPPLIIPRAKLTRWHPEFDLEKCADLALGDLPQPPNVEKFSSAKDILSTARNLFNCNTPMDRALERLEAKKKENQQQPVSNGESTGEFRPLVETENKTENPVASVLKNVPKSLLERIRAKQAAKALDEMTRRPSQEKEAIQHGRLPELARHLRNVFVTEKKGVLPLEQTLIKIENSYRGKLTLKDLEVHMRIISTLVPFWLSFHEVRKNMFVKISKDTDLSKVIGVLEKKANELSK